MTAVADVHVQTEIRGAPARLWQATRPKECVISGAAGTGKTRAILEWIHYVCQQHRVRVLFLRKTLESLKGSALVTYQEQVLHDFDGKKSILDGVVYFGGNAIRPAEFTYEATGSKIILGGMDRLSKVLSTEFNIVYVNECVELTVGEWETIGGRTDRPKMAGHGPTIDSLVIGDCNPDAPTHWIKKRADSGALTLWYSRHEDNPAMYQDGVWTTSGQRYIDRLENLTGVRYKRLRLGLWAAAEGLIYDGFDPSVHLIYRSKLPGGDVPKDWPRYWVIDFGFIHPFVWQWWAEDHDGNLYLYREIYKTRGLVEDHAMRGLMLSKDEPAPIAVITDHDAEDRATFERKTATRTIAAHKTVSDGIQAVQERLRVQENGKPRMFILRDCLDQKDQELDQAGQPTCTADEFTSYVWDLRPSVRKGEQPVKEFDHGMDAARYMMAHKDLKRKRGFHTQ